MRSRARCIAAMATGALLLAGCTQGGQGQGEDIEENGEYHPSGTVKMVVAMAPGGGSDRAMRVMSEAVNENAEGTTPWSRTAKAVGEPSAGPTSTVSTENPATW